MQFDPRHQRLLWRALAGAAVLGAAAWATHHLSRRAEAANPPRGRFVAAAGLRLHYTEHGDPGAPVLVLLHGCGALGREMEISGMVEAAAREFRVLVFDRPGYGHSQRPEAGSLTPDGQAETLVAALRALGVRKPLVLGHSWGAMVALAMGLKSPHYVRGLVLVAGYHTPSWRFDSLLLALPAVPVLGTLLRHTLSPLLGRLMLPAMLGRVFAPDRVPDRFRAEYPAGMALRPQSLRTAATEAAMQAMQAARLAHRSHALEVPTVIVAGEKDRLVMTSWQSRRLHRRAPATKLRIVPEAGHMVHHTHTPAVLAAVKEAFELSVSHVHQAPIPRRVGAAARTAEPELNDPVVTRGQPG
jgi:pimeloyl-ACP methyl ester carboxylesterase